MMRRRLAISQSFLFALGTVVLAGCNLFEPTHQPTMPPLASPDAGGEPLDAQRGQDADRFSDATNPSDARTSPRDVALDVEMAGDTGRGDADDGDLEDVFVSPPDGGRDAAPDAAPDMGAPFDGCADYLAFQPLAYWSFDSANAQGSYDNLTAASFPAFVASGGVSGSVEAYRGEAVEFDGADAFLELAHDPQLLLKEATIAFWARPDVLVDPIDPASVIGLWSKDSLGFDNGGHLTIGVNDSRLWTRIQDTRTNYTTTAAAQLVAGQWVHVAVSLGPGGFHLYENGALVGSVNYPGGLYNDGGQSVSDGAGGTRALFNLNEEPVVLGASAIFSGDQDTTDLQSFLDGAIDELLIFDAQLVDAQIAALYVACQP